MFKRRIYQFILLAVMMSYYSCSSTASLTGSGSPDLQSINVADLSTHLNFIASDEMKGRNTLTQELKVTARYIATQVESFGFTTVLENGSFFQPVTMGVKELDRENSSMNLTIRGNTKKLQLENGFTSNFVNSAKVTSDLVFLGHGVFEKVLGWDDVKDLDVIGKMAVVFAADLPNDHPVSKVNNNNSLIFRAFRLMQFQKVRGVIVISEKDEYAGSKKMFLKGKAGFGVEDLPIFSIKTNLGAEVLGVSESEVKDMIAKIKNGEQVPSRALPGVSVEITIKANESEANTQNVVAYLEGSDPILKNEYVVFGAHYDHDGTKGGEIYNGADDDGSGTVALLEIAQAFSMERPKRSVIMTWFTAEEKGLLGSEYLTDNFPVPLDKISGMINMDMVGRNTEKGLYVIGAGRLSKELYAMNEKVNKDHVKLSFDYSFDDPNDPEDLYSRSDHFNFARFGIPVLFYTTGLHDDYHKPSDTVDKIEWQQLQSVARLAYLVGKEIANKPAMLKLDADPKVTSRGKHNIGK